MSDDVYHEMFIHVVWHTKENYRFIRPQMEQLLYDFIRRRALEPGGVYVHAIGGTEDHVHLVARTNPNVPIPAWIGTIKGGSSHDINAHPDWPKSLQWQSGYGIVTFGQKDLNWVVDYVANQKDHHRTGKVFDRLERIIAEILNDANQDGKCPQPGGGPSITHRPQNAPPGFPQAPGTSGGNDV